ncbi:MAG: hypothetical protein EXQ59_01165 [Acidobacteria bacterium]|nr:hypothetical protein [Acidobacteriota bacterium]
MSLFPVAPVWTLALNAQLAVPPAYDDAHAFFALGDRLLAYRFDDGRQVWNASATLILEPVTGDGLLFITEARQLQALRVEDATIAWQIPFTEQQAAHPVWNHGRLVVTTTTGSVLTFRARDGSLAWRHELKSAAHAPATLTADRVYVPTEDGRVVTLDAGTGAPVWERRLGGAANDVLATADRVFVGSDDNYFYCLLAKDGRVDWRWRTGGDVIGKPVGDKDTVYFVSRDNVLRALDRVSGGQRWLRALPLRPTTGPIRAGGTIVISGVAPTVRGFNATDGAPAGDQSTGGELAAPAHVLDEGTNPLPRIIILTRDISKGAAALLLKRDVEPAVRGLTPLPNPVATLPKLALSGEMLER